MSDSSILIKNIYHMLAYAFRQLNQSNYEKIAVESFENIHNLFAAILSKGISQQIKQGLYREYINHADDLNVLRGKLEINGTLKNRLQKKQLLSCEFDELSEDNIYNQILKFTANLLIKQPSVKSVYKAELKKLMLYLGDVSEITSPEIKWAAIRFQRNNQSYRMLINFCYLVVEGMLFSTNKGTYSLAQFIDDQHMHKLYESFIREYFRYHYRDIRVSASFVDWDVSEDNEGLDLLPKMKTDIYLEKDEKILIIDAKYYSHNMQHHFDSNTFHSANMYQIFTYVKNKDKQQTGNVAGMLLYARTTEQIQPDNTYKMGANVIAVKTLDLNSSFSNISSQLDDIASYYFGAHKGECMYG